jgi:hypothetical protein
MVPSSSTNVAGQHWFRVGETPDASRRFATLRDKLLCQSYATAGLRPGSSSRPRARTQTPKQPGRRKRMFRILRMLAIRVMVAGDDLMTGVRRRRWLHRRDW